ncbi:MAG: glutamate racemase [Chitinophagales bacterium]|nr:glutamate racemase [Chitinophagales bacterium]
MQQKGAIGIFDSGYGGLTILKEIVNILPQYNYIYLGDNARTPYGSRSFETVYHYTWEAIQWFFNQGCSLVILACNTASAKALRTIQQKNLPLLNDPFKRVLGVIRPTAEVIDNFTHSKHIGILGTTGTVQSNSYILEIEKFFPNIKVFQQACPLWVPLIENNEHNSKGADFFVKKYIHQLLEQNANIDTFLLACTHYPLLIEKIKEYTPADIKIVTQGNIVAESLKDYLKRHPEIESLCIKQGKINFYTTDNAEQFNKQAIIFWGNNIQSQQVNISTL